MKKLPERFQSKILPEPNSGCWFWNGAIDSRGYGRISVAGKNKLAHREVFLRLKRNLAAEECLDHLCRIRCCVNPEHLEPVTLAENIRRGNHKYNKLKTHCKYGHEFNIENIRFYKTERACRECNRIRMRRRRQT